MENGTRILHLLTMRQRRNPLRPEMEESRPAFPPRHLPFPAIVLRENGYHPFHRAQDGAVDDHGPVLLIPVLTEKMKNAH